jgi:hypothetical protein
MRIPLVVSVLITSFVLVTAAQDVSKIVTKADVEKAAGATFGDGTTPMDGQRMFQQQGGDLQVSVELESRDAGSTVRAWEATMKKMRPDQKVDTVNGVGSDAIYYSTRADMGALSADFEKPRVQMRVSVSGAKTPALAMQVVTDLARAIAPRVGK